jgi:hypothetical protein
MADSNTEQLPRIESPAFYAMLDMVENARADALQLATKKTKAAKTRLRVKLSEIAKLCKQARKELPPDGAAGET